MNTLRPSSWLVATLLLVLLLGLAATPANGRDLELEITPFGGFRFGGGFETEEPFGEYKLDDSASFGLLVNWNHQVNTQYEVLYSFQSASAAFNDLAVDAPDLDVDLHVLQLGGTYVGDGEKVFPYLAATLGGTHARTSAPDSGSDTFFSASIGLGFKYLPSDSFGLRFEVRGYGTLINSSSSLFCRTGPDENVCAIKLRGESLTQVETFAGIVFRF